MGELTEMNVTMNADAWRKVADAAKAKAVSLVCGGDSADRLIKAAQLLRAADTFTGRAELMELLGRKPDEAVMVAWDLADEGMPGEVVPV